MPPSAGLGHRLRVQGAGREFAGRQDAILEKVWLEADLRDRVPERLPRHCNSAKPRYLDSDSGICETQVTTRRTRFAILMALLFSSQLYTDLSYWTYRPFQA